MIAPLTFADRKPDTMKVLGDPFAFHTWNRQVLYRYRDGNLDYNHRLWVSYVDHMDEKIASGDWVVYP